MSDNQVVTALKGQDTEDLLEHIAWQEVILPALRADQKRLTDSLVGQVLGQQGAPAESREQLAGKIFGIEWTIKKIEKIVVDGRAAKASLAAEQNYFTR